MVEWKKKTVKEAIEDREDIITLHFNGKEYFDIEGTEDSTDGYGNFEFNLDSFFVMEILGLNEDNTVEEVVQRASNYLRKHRKERIE
jgi:hypothetical protein